MTTLAKLTPPTATQAHPRTRLFRMLDAQQQVPVTWISAPAGAGKTLLVASYLRAREIQPLWYRVDTGDGDPAAFFHFLQEGLKQLNPDAIHMPLRWRADQGDPVAFARQFFRHLFSVLGTPGVWVLDDVETLHDHASFNEILCHGLQEVPRGCRVIVISRSEPPARFARLEAEDRLSHLHWHDLRLTADECRAIATLLAPERKLSQPELDRLQQTTHGWVTGLVLRLRSAVPRPEAGPIPADGLPQCQFAAYFASEIYDHLPGETRALLLKTAWLPTVHPEDATRLAGLEDAGQRLEWLAQRQLFIARLAGGRPAYVYHPLLRAFLQSLAETALPPDECRLLKQRAAERLAETSDWDGAARLWEEIEDWDALEKLILTRAEQLLRAGRHYRLHNWLTALPITRAQADPWLVYWHGAAALAFDPGTASHHFRTALDRFAVTGEAKGAYLAWLGVMDGIMFANDSLAETVRWLAELERLEQRLGPCPDPAIAGRVAFTAFNMGFTACPEQRSIAYWEETAEMLRQGLPAIADDTARCLAAASLAMFFTWHPQPARLTLLADALQPLIEDTRIAPLARVLAALVEITRRWNRGETVGTDALIERALALVDDHGLSVARLWLLSAAAIHYLVQQDADRAQTLLDRYRRHIRPGNRHEAVHYHYLAGWLAHLRGENELAREHTARAHADILPLRSPHFELLARTAHAFMLIETGHPDEARALIEKTRHRAAECHSRSVEVFSLGLLEAWSAWRTGDVQAAAAPLRAAFACGREMDLQVILWHRPPMLARLCAIALEQAIETDYVRRFIRRNGLGRPPGSDLLSPWPDRLRLRTLGDFSISRDDRPLSAAGRSHRKPLHLLKLLIALGGRKVPAHRIEDTLWPDADGADARRALITTIQRLRKWLDVPGALRFDQGCLSLDPDRVWLDVWALDEALEQNDPQRIDRALRLYRGRLLFDEEGDPAWVLAARERLHDAVLNAYERLGGQLADQGRWDALIDLCRRGLAIDDLHEPFYREHMRALIELGRHAEAVCLYQRCRRRLWDGLGQPPSPATQALIET